MKRIAALTDQLQRLGKIDFAGRRQSGDLAKTVTDKSAGLQSPLRKEAVKGIAADKNRRMGVVGLPQVFRGGFAGAIRRPDQCAHRSAAAGQPVGICLVKPAAHGVMTPVNILQHVGILRGLAGEHHRRGSRGNHRSLLVKDAAGAQQFGIEALALLGEKLKFALQLRKRGGRNRQAAVLPRAHRIVVQGAGLRQRDALITAGEKVVDLFGKLRACGGGEKDDRLFGGRGAAGLTCGGAGKRRTGLDTPGRRGRPGCGQGETRRRLSRSGRRHRGRGRERRHIHARAADAAEILLAVLLEGDVVIGAAEAEGADIGAARMAGAGLPLARLIDDVERRAFNLETGIDLGKTGRRRQGFVMQGEHRLDETGNAGGRL